MSRIFAKIFLTLVTFFICAQAGAQATKIVGSDVVGPVLMRAVGASMKKSNLTAEPLFTGTRTGVEDLSKGLADICIIAVPKGGAMPEGVITVPICHQAAVVIVNNQNPIEEISFDTLMGIYGKSANPRIESWVEVSKSAASLRTIFPVVTNFMDNLVVELFKYSVLKGDDLGPWVNVSKSRMDAFNTVKTNNLAVSIVGKPEANAVYKVLSVSTGAGQFAFKPTAETIHTGDYPMVLNFYLAFKKENYAKLKLIVASFLSDETAKSIDAGDFYSVPQNYRKRSILELDIMK